MRPALLGTLVALAIVAMCAAVMVQGSLALLDSAHRMADRIEAER